MTHNGIGTPLVRSQVLPYLRLLAARGHEIDLVTFERGEPFPEGEFPRERWHGLTPRPGRSLAAKIIDIARGVWVIARLARRRRAEVLHARSYLPAAICWLVGGALRIPYIFDMRGFLGEEYVDAGIWAPADVRYLALRAAEGHLLRDAAEIVVLTQAGARRLCSECRYARSTRGKNISVVPCAVDLDLFRPVEVRGTTPTLVYSGTLGMWYLLDEMIQVYAQALEKEPSLRFLFLNRREHELIRGAWAAAGLSPERLEIRAVDFGGMPLELSRAHVAIALLKRAPSKVGSSPIKIGEYFACGLPVVVNEGLGDSDEQIRSAGAGHVVAGYDAGSLAAAGAAVATLSADAVARARARDVAERIFDVRAGAATYADIYSRIAHGRRG